MTRLIPLQTEKSLSHAKNNTFVLVADDLNAIDINKIQLTIALAAKKLDVIRVNIIRLPAKYKSKQGKKGGKSTKVIKRAKKYIVTLKAKQTIDEKFELVV